MLIMIVSYGHSGRCLDGCSYMCYITVVFLQSPSTTDSTLHTLVHCNLRYVILFTCTILGNLRI